MYKILIIILLMVSSFAKASQLYNSFSDDSLSVQAADSTKETLTFQQVDSITYQCYLVGNWDKLINTGKEAISQQIDYKRLRQRMGYAYFAKTDYYSSMNHYEKALKFDKTDSDTRLYLYYCGLYTGNNAYTRYQLGKLPYETRKNLKAKPFKIVDAVDAEYNLKTNDNKTRYDANYGRLGVSTKLGYRLSLYQSVSTFAQLVDSSGLKQNEYYAGLKWNVCPKIDFMIAYHYLNSTIIDSVTYRRQLPWRGKAMDISKDTLPGNLFYSKISFIVNRFQFGLSGSLFNYSKYDSIKLAYTKALTQQYTFDAGVTLPGKLNLNLKSSLTAMFDLQTRRLIFSQKIGALLSKNFWLEGNVTFGNLKNYTEYDGLYVFNADDATTFKTGLGFFWNLTPNICFLGNYTYNMKYFDKNNIIIKYNQNSFSTGIIWKI